MMRDVDKYLSLEFESSKLSKMRFYFRNGGFIFDKTENFLLFQTAFQMFLQGHLSQEKTTIELSKVYKTEIYGDTIPLWFTRYIDLTFTKISESNTQYLRIEASNYRLIAKSSDKNNSKIKGYEEYFDSTLHPPDFEPLTLTLKRFAVQYYYNILQKVSYKW